jgi:hypothetical protein
MGNRRYADDTVVFGLNIALKRGKMDLEQTEIVDTEEQIAALFKQIALLGYTREHAHGWVDLVFDEVKPKVNS